MWGISAGVCGIRNDVYVQVCGLCLDVCFFLFLCDGSGLHDPDCDWNRDSAAHLAKSARGLTCHCEWKPNILQPIHFGCLRERERDAETEGGGKRKRELKCPSLSPSVCLPVTLDSSVAIQSDQTSYRLSFSGPVRLQQPQLHRKRGWNKQESKRGADEERRRAKRWPQWHEALTAGRRNAGKQDN